MAKYYIYRNLRLKDTFSIRHRGKVVARHTMALARNVKFQVSEVGRQQVLREKRKNVHAYVVADDVVPYTEAIGTSQLQRITYNPYTGPHFTIDGHPITSAKAVLFEAGSCWLVR